MEEIFEGIFAQLELIEEFYVLDLKEQLIIKRIKKGINTLHSVSPF